MADKTEYALHHGLKAIVCIGETLEQRESGELWNVLDSQLKVRGDSRPVGLHQVSVMRHCKCSWPQQTSLRMVTVLITYLS